QVRGGGEGTPGEDELPPRRRGVPRLAIPRPRQAPARPRGRCQGGRSQGAGGIQTRLGLGQDRGRVAGRRTGGRPIPEGGQRQKRIALMAADSSEQFVLLNHLADEFAARYRRGERPALQEYIDRHPELADDILEFFPAMAEMEQVKDERRQVREPPAAGPLPPLERLGDYRIIREIGRGGMGVVYEAEQVSLGRHVALKVLPKQLLLDARTKRRFEREAKAAAKLHHTNIVPVFGVGEHEGLPYYVMQFIPGLGLDEVLEELRRLQPVGHVSNVPLSARHVGNVPHKDV